MNLSIYIYIRYLALSPGYSVHHKVTFINTEDFSEGAGQS